MVMLVSTMNNETVEGTIHVTAPSILNKPSQTMPQRSPFAIQELLGLGADGPTAVGPGHNHRSPTAAVSAITPNVYAAQRHVQPPTCFPSDPAFNHHHMTMAASRMAYFNAQAAVAAAFLPHNIAAAAGMGGSPGAGNPAAVLGLTAGHQTSSGPGRRLRLFYLTKKNYNFEPKYTNFFGTGTMISLHLIYKIYLKLFIVFINE